MKIQQISIFLGLAMIAWGARGDVEPAVALQAQPFPLSQVRLLDSPFRAAMLRDENYLLSLDCDRLLRNFRVNANLPTDAKPYSGWEDPNCELRGHCVGHYLSACSLMFASTGDKRFKERAEKIVAGFAECQNALATNGSHAGYLSALRATLSSFRINRRRLSDLQKRAPRKSRGPQDCAARLF